MATVRLQELIDEAGSELAYLRSTKWHLRENPSYYPPLIVPQIPYEFSQWAREQQAWRESVALLDQTHHMGAVYVRGPGARGFLAHLATNDLSAVGMDRAHQLLMCNAQGNIIGDSIMLQLSTNEYWVCGPYVLNWILFQASLGGHDVDVELDGRSPVYANGHGHTRRQFRYQIQGPNAVGLIEALNGAPIPPVRFFGVTNVTIAGIEVKGLRHGMAGAMGMEIWGRWDDRDRIRDEILRVGEAFGIVEVGSAAYLSTTVESGWFPGGIPAIYDEDLRAYREWIGINERESLNRLVGSYQGTTIEDFYRTPSDVGYGHLVDLEHDFIGRDALKSMGNSSRTRKVTLQCNADDVARLTKEMLSPDGMNVKPLHLPHLDDKCDVRYDLLTIDENQVGIAHYGGYTANEKALLFIALVNPDVEVGAEVVLHWGDVGGGCGQYRSRATDVLPIRAVVSPAPYSRVAREEYSRERQASHSL